CDLLRRGARRDDGDDEAESATGALARDSESGALARDSETGALARAVRGFPLAGAAVGLAAAIVFVAARLLGLPMFAAGAAALATASFASGALFESGLARFGETAVRRAGRDELLASMRNRTPGFYGIVVIVCILAMKIGALAAIAGTGRASAALVAAGAVSWTAMPVLLYLLPAAADRGLAARAGVPAFNELAIAAALAAAVALLVLGPWTGIIALAFAAVGAFKIYWFSRRMVGGVTGAALGAAQQAAETGVLLAVAAVG
ncbi:MAG: adenosylcobinamide-GDP ribazoletransferase, partial [Pseudomonadota bacterium]